jgi:hypothetical protein
MSGSAEPTIECEIGLGKFVAATVVALVASGSVLLAQTVTP